MVTPPPDLTVRDNPDRHRFEIDVGDGSFVFAEYTVPAGKIMFTHTEVRRTTKARASAPR